MNYRDPLIRIMCAHHLADQLNESNNILRIYSKALRDDTIHSLSLKMAMAQVIDRMAKHSAPLNDELNALAPYLREGVDDDFKRDIHHKVMDRAMIIMGYNHAGDGLLQHPKDGRTPVGFLADFAESCFRKHHNDTLAAVGLAGLIHYGPGDLTGVDYPEYMAGIEAMIELVPDPQGRNKARGLFQVLTNRD